MKFAASAGWFAKGYPDIVKLVKNSGFSAFENLGWKGLDLELTGELLREYGITNTALFFATEDEVSNKLATWRHGMVYEDAKPHVLKAVRETVVAAKKLGTPNIVVITGDERVDVSRAVQFENCVSTLKAASEIAEAEGVTICVEPLNRIVDHKGYFLNKSSEGFELIRAVDSPAVRLLFDVYHQQVTEGNVIRNLTENLTLIGHIHVADNPGRNQPGTGEINYHNVFSSLRDAGYDKYIAFECGSTLPFDELICEMHKLIDEFES